MCGINGYINFEFRGEKHFFDRIEKMNKALSHRGPDDSGVYIGENLGLGHTRLSIIDLSELGHQPMHFNEHLIIFNGEIYNFLDLKSRLIKLGHSFKSNSDTEVLLHCFLEYGEKCFDLIEGMFAFFILNKKTGVGYLVRDRLGIKPIYYYYNGKNFIFSSEMSAIESFEEITLNINDEIVPYYLKLLYTPKNQTPYKEIKKLPAGSYIKIDTKNLDFKFNNYWSLKNINHNNSSKKYDWENIKSLIINSIEKRLISDVPIGLWLSGGVDSSLIAGIISKELGVKLNTFSYTYTKDYEHLSESSRAEYVSKSLNHNHKTIAIDPVKIFSNIDEILSKQEEWIGNPAALIYHKLSEETKQHVTVALTGTGGDELFGGYNRYRALKLMNFINKVPLNFKFMNSLLNKYIPQSRLSMMGDLGRALIKIFGAKDKNLYNSYLRLISYMNLDDINDIDMNFDMTGDIMNDVMRFDIKNYLAEDLLLLSDKMSMANSLELRVPLIDHTILEAAFSVDSSKRMGKAGSKMYLRRWLQSYIDLNELNRRKMGFAIPIEPYLRELGINELSKIFEKSEIFSYIKKMDTNTMLESFFNKGEDYVNQIYSLYVLAKWRLKKNK